LLSGGRDSLSSARYDQEKKIPLIAKPPPSFFLMSRNGYCAIMQEPNSYELPHSADPMSLHLGGDGALLLGADSLIVQTNSAPKPAQSLLSTCFGLVGDRI
jgi:hypothetical protein